MDPWPEDLQDPASPAVAEFRSTEAEAVEFHQWLQWLLDRQLAAVQQEARDAGMSLGVVHDLAVGVHPGGADAWGLGDALARGVYVGAPPDQFNQLGQNWTQPPWRPDRLAELGYTPCRDMLRTVLKDSGGSGWTTSSGCSGCGGSRRAWAPTRAPTSATTTRR